MDFVAPVTSDPHHPEFGPPARAAADSCAWSLSVDTGPSVGVAATGAPASVAIPLTWLDGNRRDECWFGGAAADQETHDGLQLFSTGELLFGVIDTLEGSDAAAIEQTIAAMYARVQQVCANRAYPHLLRFWNFFGDINAGEGDRERYRRFCVGRASVLAEAPAGGFPAATAIGIPGGSRRVHVSFLASRRRGVAIENPRQTSAWQYPREFGPVAPGFSRAMLLPWLPEPLLLVSGTASVLGHDSVHADTESQLVEALRNVEQVITAATRVVERPLAMGRGGSLRIYLREASEAAAIAAQLRERLPFGVDWMLLHGDICRRDLRVELELKQRCVTWS